MSNEQTEIAVQAPSPMQDPEAPDNLNMSGALLKQIQEAAKLYPRNIKQAKENIWAELEFAPDLAARSYYSIPYNQGKANETRVEGLSIKAAMLLARNWGNCFNGGRVISEDEASIYAEGAFIDLQTNTTTTRQLRIPKFYKPRGANSVVPKNADMLQNSVQAGISKAIRNAILASLPDWLTFAYFQKAKDLVLHPPQIGAVAVKSIQERVLDGKALIMKKFKVTAEEMERYLTDNADSIEDDASLLVHLQGLCNSLIEGQTSVEAVFRSKNIDAAPEMPQEK